MEPLLIERGPLLNFSGGGFWAPHPHRLELVWYKQLEYRFQAMKTRYLVYAHQGQAERLHDEIMAAVDCFAAKAAGRLLPIHVDAWDDASPRIMLEAMLLKFTQNPITFDVLLSTGDRPLVEHRPDPIWGDNMDGTGKNLAGLALEHVREKLR